MNQVIKQTNPYIPKFLIYEQNDGQNIYYRGYKDVLQQKKRPEAVMGSSYLQSLVIARLLRFLFTNLPDSYEILTNELGLQFSKGKWRAADIGIYHQEQLREVEIHDKYMDIPPKVVIEIDIKADLEAFDTSVGYYATKTDELLDFGVEKVIWIFTEARKVLVAEAGKDWTICNWDSKIVVIDAITFELSKLIKQLPSS